MFEKHSFFYHTFTGVSRDIYFRRCMIAALANPAFSIVCSESVSSLLGKVVNRANACVAYCGRAL